MRTFYIFKIRKEIVNLYGNCPNNLYNVLKRLYYMKREEYSYGMSLFSQLTCKINKFEIDKNIYVKYHNKMIYSKNKEEHIINNLYKDEISIMVVKNAYIFINCNRNYSSFFEIINKLDSNYFVCDFTNKDYFWINDIKMLV